MGENDRRSEEDRQFANQRSKSTGKSIAKSEREKKHITDTRTREGRKEKQTVEIRAHNPRFIDSSFCYHRKTKRT